MPKSAAANPSVIPTPPDSGSLIRKAFIAEAIANLGTLPLITHPRWLLSQLLLSPSQITPSTVLFARVCGALVIGGLTSALLAGASNTRNGIESRRVVYLMLGLGEVALIPILIAEGMKDGVDAALSKTSAYGSVGILAAPLLWRVYVLCVKPEWLGSYVEVGAEGKKTH